MYHSNTGQTGSRGSARATLLRWSSVLALLAVIAASGAMARPAAPANAIIRFCTATVCIGSANGCSTPTTTGVVIEADDGDSFIAADGTKWTCTHGKWVKTATAKVQVNTRGPVLGIGLFFRGRKPDDPCDLIPAFRGSMDLGGISECQPPIILE